MKKLFTLLFLVLFSKFSIGQDAALASPSGSFTSPSSGCSLTASENVTIHIFNYGSGSITVPFDVSYTINSGIPVTETVPATVIPQNTSYTYTFTTKADLSTPAVYSFEATVFVPGDPTPGNDTYTGYVVNALSPSIGGSITAPASVCTTGNSGSLSLSGHTGSVLGWQYSTDGGGTWFNISNTSTSQSYNAIAIPTKYRVQVQNGACTPVYSAISTITIDPVTVGGSVSSSVTVCKTANGGVLTSGGARVGTVTKWQYSTNGGATYTDTAITASTLNYLNLATTTVYRVQATSGACASAYSSPATITVSPPSVGGTVNTSVTVCGGTNSGTLTLSGYTGTITRWEYSTNGGGVWTNIANVTTSQAYTNLNTTTMYRAYVQSGTCVMDYSVPATITVAPATVGGSVTSNATECSGTNSGTLTLAGYTGTIQYWEYSTNGGTTYTNIPNTGTTQAYLNLTTTTIYRANIKNGACPAANSTTATITVNPLSVGGSVTPKMQVCSGVNSGTVTLSGNTGAVQNWEYSTDGITWTPIVNATTSNSFTNLAASTYYRAVVKSGVCSSVKSNPDTVIVDQPSVGGSVSPNASVCNGNNSGTLTLGGNTGNVIRWEYSLDNGATFNNIVNTALTNNYTNVTSTTVYRAIVKNGTCSTTNSSTATLTVTPISNGGVVNGGTTVCGGSNTGTLSLTGRVGTVQNWISSTNGGVTWTSIPNITTSLTYTNILTTTYYRAVVKSGNCSTDTSSIGIMTVDPISDGGILSKNDTVCVNSNAGTLTLSGYTGTIQHWESSIDGGLTWLILGNTTASQSYLNLAATTSYRVYVKSGICNGMTSTIATIKVEPGIKGGTTTGSTTYCGNINTGFLSLTGSSGPILNWEYSSNNGLSWTTLANTSVNQTYFNLTDTTWYRAIVGNVGCGKDTSTTAIITINPKTIGGILSANDTVCAGSNSGTLHLTGYVGAVQGWEASTNGGAVWTPLINLTDSLVYSNILTTTAYRVNIKSGTCNADTSNRIVIRVNPAANGGTVSSVSVCDTMNSGTLVLTGAVGNVLYWEKSTDGGTSWNTVANTTTSLNFTNLKDTTLFRAHVSVGICGKDTSAVGIVYVNSKTIAGVVTANATVCGGINKGTLHLNSYRGIIQNWEQSTDGIVWLPIVNTTDSLVYTNVIATTWYHAKVKNGSCTTDTSTHATITVNPQAVGGVIPPVTVCDTINNGSMVLNGSVGAVIYWQSSVNGGVTWDSIPTTTTTLNYTNVKDTTLYRAIVKTLCSRDTSAIGTLFVNPRTLAGIISKSDSVCFGANNGVLHVTGYHGNILEWQQSVNGTIWSTLPITVDSLMYLNLTVSTNYRVIVKNNTCPADTSRSILIYVNPISVGGTLNTASGISCGGKNNGVVTLSGYTGSIQFWMSSTTNGTTWDTITHKLPSLVYSNILLSTIYKVVLKSGNCPSTISNSVTVNINPSPKAVFTADSVCYGGVTTFKNSSSISSGFILLTDWNLGDGAVSYSKNPTHRYASPGTYDVSLQLTSALGCMDTAKVKVIVKNVPPATIVSSTGKNIFCLGESLTLLASSGPYNYLWNGSATTKNIVVTAAGMYKLVVTDQVGGCTARDSVYIKVVDAPIVFAGKDTTLSLGQSIRLQPLSNTNIISWGWHPEISLSDPFTQNPVATPLVTTTYNLIVIDVNGCSSIDSLTVTVLDDFNVIVSNMMTPNNDGYNDTWIIQNIENYPGTKVVVLTREGQEVFNSDSYNNTWNGTMDGKKLPDGTYYYIIKFKGTTKVYKGAITILGQK